MLSNKVQRELSIKGQIPLQNEELHNLYRSPNIVRVIKCRIVRLRWAGSLN